MSSKEGEDDKEVSYYDKVRPPPPPQTSSRWRSYTTTVKQASISPPPPKTLKKSVSVSIEEESRRDRHSCRILLTSDFSEECDDELAFIYLIQGCKKYENISFVVELLVTDTPARIQWFEYIYKEQFEEKKWSWIDPLWLRHSCTDLQFNAAPNVLVRMYCTETSKRDLVRSRLPEIVTETVPRREDISDHTKIPQDEPLHFILWNSPIPTSISESWFEKFSNKFGGISRLSFEDGIVRTFQTGGPGSLNSKPHDHFIRVSKVLGMNRKSILMLTPEFTRNILLSREMVDSLGPKLRHRVYSTFVKFLAQRPEIKGKTDLVMRLNKSNAVLCTEWMELMMAATSTERSSLTWQDRERAREYVSAYVNRNAPGCSKEYQEELSRAVLKCVECAVELLGDKKKSGGGLESIYVDPSKSLCELKDQNRCVKLASDKLTSIRFLTPAYDCVSVAVMFQYLSAETVFVPTQLELRRLSSTSQQHNDVEEEEKFDEENNTTTLLRKIHDMTRVMQSALGLGHIHPASLLYDCFKEKKSDGGGKSNNNIFVAATQSRSVVEKYANDIKLSFFTVPCRILLMSDFSEECDDEVAFELLIKACTRLTQIHFTIEVLLPDAVERLAWFAHVFSSHFQERDVRRAWKWKRRFGKESPTPFQFECGKSNNVVVRLYCTEESTKKAKVAEKLKKTLSSRRYYLPAEMSSIPDHESIPHDEPLHYILWNSPVPITIKPTWFSNFHNYNNNNTTTRLFPFHDGVLRVLQIGGEGSINSLPDEHFRKILSVLSKSDHSTSTVMFLKEVTRRVKISRGVTNYLPRQVQKAVYNNFVKFMAKRPEFPGGIKLLLRINKGNANMCREWMDASGLESFLSPDEKRNAMKWSEAYVNRYTTSGDDETLVKDLKESVYTCVVCSLNLLCDREKGANSLYKDPTRSLSKLYDEKACVKRARDELIKISRLTPAYDCVSVAAMLRHITKSSSTPSTQNHHSTAVEDVDSMWTGLGWNRMHKYSVNSGSKSDDHVFEIPEQSRTVCMRLTEEIESYFGREEGREIPSPLMRSPSEDNVLLGSSSSGGVLLRRNHRLQNSERTKSAPMERILETLESVRCSLRLKAEKLKQTEEELAKAKKELARRSVTP